MSQLVSFCTNIPQIFASLLCMLVYIFPYVIKMALNRLFSPKIISYLLIRLMSMFQRFGIKLLDWAFIVVMFLIF